MASEVWRDIGGYEGKYRISNLGNVKSLNYQMTGSVRNLRPFMCGNGYLHVELSGKGHKVHRLVAKSFVGNPRDYDEINHIDEDKLNNRASNLEWCSRQYNVNYGSAQARRVKSNDWEKMARKLRKPIQQFDLSGEPIRKYKSMKEAEVKTGIRNGNISKCCNGHAETAGGYIWRFI